MSSGTAKDSICPRGWILATNYGNKSYSNLISSVYGGIINTSWIDKKSDSILIYNPLSFLRSGDFGHYNGSGLKGGRNISGSYWESRTASTTNAYSLFFNSTLLYPQSGRDRGYGFSVRCVSKS